LKPLTTGMMFRSPGKSRLLIILKIEPMSYGNYSRVYYLASDTGQIESWPTGPENVQNYEQFCKSLIWDYVNDT
jgi:hypothetical protein